MDLWQYDASSKSISALNGGGGAGARLRALDWSKTPLGTLDSWPQTLRTVVSLVLDSNVPLCLAWGPDFVQFYNDAYESILGLKTHATALGRRAGESRPEIWDKLGPLFRDVLNCGEPTCQQDTLFLLDRNGYPEETYFTCYLNPIRDELGKLGGVLVNVTETTERVLTSRRLRTLRDLAAAASNAMSAAVACETAARTLAGNAADIPFALLYLLDAGGSTARLAGAAGLVGGTRASPLVLDLRGPPDTSGWPIARVASSGRSEIVTDLIGCLGSVPGGAWPEPPHTAHAIPLFRPGRQPPACGVLIVAFNARRAVDEHYRAFLDLVSIQVDATVGKACANEDARQRIAEVNQSLLDPSANKGAEPESDGEARFHTLADNIAQLVWMADPTGWIFWYNRRWYDYTGTTLEEMRGWGWRMAHHPEHVDRVVEKIRHCFETGQVWEDTFPLRARDGSYRWFLSRAIPIRDEAGKVACWLGTNTDVTAERAAEEGLRAADRRKDEFLAVLGHELRNPLAPIVSAAKLLSLRSSDDPQTQKASAIIVRQTKQLTKLVDDLLDVGRITTGKLRLHKETLELRPLLSQAIETCRPEIERRRHALQVALPAEPVYLEADGVRIVQVICNLLNNAAKYTPEGGRIWMTAGLEAGKITVRVRDDGIGIPIDMLTQVFEPFIQLRRGLRRAEGGFGIGLPLVKSIVERHGGTVEARSDGPGTGSEFRVDLPALRNTSGTQAQVDTPLSRTTFDTRRVLIVDDNRDSAEMLAALLLEWNQDVRVAYDGATAFDLAQTYRPDLVLIDLGLPGMSGADIARRLRTESDLQRAAIVAVTGLGHEATRRLSLEAGFDAHFVKPLNAEVLQELLVRFTADTRS